MDVTKKWAIAGVLLGVMVILLMYSTQLHDTSQKNETQNKEFRWYNSPQEAIDEASKHNKRVILIFSASWCPSCRKLEEETLQNPDVLGKISENYIAAKIDVDSNPSAASTYGIYVIPTTIILDSSGNEIGRREGYMAPEEFLSYLG
ncbi:thioredoxin fold domain-containing protein [Methanothermobacter sp.]|uniref:thioredoxin family protein n=1 Tax=Methanothermobacter sp. TaxID=1884223 RepID=UPI00260A317E|nr:thioredoxin fold domain-containing protein [Methanothermobacter sp.]MDI9615462.1 thioredoxin fold domain-containing protein [Methanothermobacter sp.]